MSLVQIPTLTDGTPAYRQRTRLEGEDWLLDFVFNSREGIWFLSILDLEGTTVLRGQPIMCGLPLLQRCVGGPPGVMWAVSADGTQEPAGLTELGGRVRLWYADSEDEAVAG
jgi:hypothetical protein